MIRFMPDTWLEALVRPVAMAVPAGGIYAETIAPDFRFVFAIALSLGWLVYRVRARGTAARTLSVLAFCAATFAPWLATSGNGRYFMLTLFIVGPVCVALLHHLPLSRGARLGLLGVMLALQVGLLHEVAPWNSWGLAAWKDGEAFALQVPQDLRNQPQTYVTLTGISYSLIAPKFHPASRWVNIASVRGGPGGRADQKRVHDMLAASSRISVVFPSLVGTLGNKAPPADQSDAVDLALADVELRLARADCRVLPSGGLTAVGARPGEQMDSRPPRGFWVCSAAHVPPGPATSKPKPSAEIEAVMDKVEQLCPRMFVPGGAATAILPMGYLRHYVDSDMRLYVTNDGQVMYKYMRALNPVHLGRIDEVNSSGFRMDCNVRGRSGLPWDREI